MVFMYWGFIGFLFVVCFVWCSGFFWFSFDKYAVWACWFDWFFCVCFFVS